jgi:hypothetical protein
VKIHELKTWPVYFDQLKRGLKRFEYRRNDRDFQVGDVLQLEEWDPETGEYTGRWMALRVWSMMTDCPGLPEGYCIMQVQDAMSQLFPAQDPVTVGGALAHSPAQLPTVAEFLRGLWDGWIASWN